jgi:hypothetical protein
MTTKLCAVGDFRSRLLSGLHMYPRDQGGAEMAADMYFGLYTYLVVHVYSPASTESTTTSTVQRQQSDPNLSQMTSCIIAIYPHTHNNRKSRTSLWCQGWTTYGKRWPAYRLNQSCTIGNVSKGLMRTSAPSVMNYLGIEGTTHYCHGPRPRPAVRFAYYYYRRQPKPP